MISRCVQEEELVRFLDGELTENESDRVRRHLRACAVCAARSAQLERALQELKEPLPDVDLQAAVEDVMRRLPMAVADPRARPGSRTVRWGLLGSGLAAAAVMSVLVIAPIRWHAAGEDTEAFRARGSPLGSSMARAVGVSLYRSSRARDARELLAPDSHVRPNDAYAVRYRNLLQEPVYLLHWVCPTYLDPASNPVALSLSPSTTEAAVLPGAVELETPASGHMRFVGILSLSPLHVLDVDNLHGEELTLASLRARWPAADIRELAAVQVEPEMEEQR